MTLSSIRWYKLRSRSKTWSAQVKATKGFDAIDRQRASRDISGKPGLIRVAKGEKRNYEDHDQLYPPANAPHCPAWPLSLGLPLERRLIRQERRAMVISYGTPSVSPVSGRVVGGKLPCQVRHISMIGFNGADRVQASVDRRLKEWGAKNDRRAGSGSRRGSFINSGDCSRLE